MKIARWAIQGLGALIVAGAAAYLLTAHSAPRAVHAPGPQTVARRGPWSDPPSSQSSGWVREQWIMKNQLAVVQDQWRQDGCPPLFEGNATYFFSFTGQDTSGGNRMAMQGPPIQTAPTWWSWPLPPTGFPKPGQRGC